MSRWVVPERPTTVKATDQNGEPPDGPLSRVVKYVPTEVVAAFTLLFTALVSLGVTADQAKLAASGLIAVFFVVTILHVARDAPKGVVRQAHLVVSPLSFLAWAYPISSAMLGGWFVPLASFFAQAIVIALALVIKPSEAK
uniref:Uncharacterized protein n=1 Tax=Caulobacter sp. (strain K31) TaxID=366602 RepID=B0T713_CAUSK